MSSISLEKGIPTAFGLSPGRSTVADIEEKFGAVENVEEIDGAQLFSFSRGCIQAAKGVGESSVCTLWISVDSDESCAVPHFLDEARAIFPDLKVVDRPGNGILFAECSGVKVACDLTQESRRILWLELSRQ